jgi:glycosyltransferase involved in cell wall biosynthesis
MIATRQEEGRSMKIAYAVPMIWTCGGILAVFHHLNELGDRGHEASLFAPDHDPLDWFPLQAPITTFSVNSEVETTFDVVVFVGDVFRKVHFPNARQQFLLLQDKDYLWVGPGDRTALLHAYADPRYHILAVSHWLADFVRDLRGNSRVSVIGNGVDLSRFYPNPTPRERFRLLIEGNFPNPKKNVLDAIEIASRVRQHESVEVWALGQHLMSAGSLVDRVFENPAQDTIPWIYQQCDLLIKTPVMEGFGLPQLEAMACGCVPATYSSGGVLDFCRHNENSLVAGVGNLPLMVWNIRRFLRDPGLRSRLQANAVATARSRPWSRVAEHLESIFGEELGRS